VQVRSFPAQLSGVARFATPELRPSYGARLTTALRSNFVGIRLSTRYIPEWTSAGQTGKRNRDPIGSERSTKRHRGSRDGIQLSISEKLAAPGVSLAKFYLMTVL